MHYYSLKNKILISNQEYPHLQNISEDVAKASSGIIYTLHQMDPLISRRCYCVSDPSLAFPKEEGLHLLQNQKKYEASLPDWLISKIKTGKVSAINTLYPNWEDVLHSKKPDPWKIHVVGMGDVGGTLVTGLRLLGGDHISEIGIYDKKENNMKRWEYEINQILSPCDEKKSPTISILSEDELFDCDLFVFCVSVGVPPVGKEGGDVRVAQFEGNAKIVGIYSKMARQKNFKGIFAVVSDPVDLLCKAAFLESNKDDSGNLDFKGLSADQIRGYGLGVMHARAAYYSGKNPKINHYAKEGRAYGPHGEGLVIADSIENYNHEESLILTEQTKTANLSVRATGFKPFIAPSLSSGSYALLATIKGDWHYSATYMGGVFMGTKNRMLDTGIEIERLDLPEKLLNRLENTYESLSSII